MFTILGGEKPRESVKVRIRVRGDVSARSNTRPLTRTVSVPIEGELGARGTIGLPEFTLAVPVAGELGAAGIVGGSPKTLRSTLTGELAARAVVTKAVRSQIRAEIAAARLPPVIPKTVGVEFSGIFYARPRLLVRAPIVGDTEGGFNNRLRTPVRGSLGSGAIYGAKWWQTRARPANRANDRRSGGSYFQSDGCDLKCTRTKYEKFSGIMEGNNGQNKNEAIAKLDSTEYNMERLTGGPLVNGWNNTIGVEGVECSLDFKKTNSNFRAAWNWMRKGTILSHTRNSQPDNLPSAIKISSDPDVYSYNSTYWDQVLNGDWDWAWKNYGYRLATLFLSTTGPNALNPAGHDPMDYVWRMNHENTQSNNFRVGPTNTLMDKYKRANERIIDLVRTGADHASRYVADSIHFAFAPAHDHEGLNYGGYTKMCPANVDVFSMSYHPNFKNKDKAGMIKYLNGTDLPAGECYSFYEMWNEAAKRSGVCCFYPEWSPRFEVKRDPQGRILNIIATPDAYSAIDEFDKFLTATKADNLCDMVFNPNIMNKGACQWTENQAACDAWDAGVDRYKTQWSGVKVN